MSAHILSKVEAEMRWQVRLGDGRVDKLLEDNYVNHIERRSPVVEPV